MKEGIPLSLECPVIQAGLGGFQRLDGVGSTMTGLNPSCCSM